MENNNENNPVAAAAEQIQQAAAEKPKRKRRAKVETPPEEPQPEAVQEVVVTFSGISADDVSKAVASLLAAVAERTKTERPKPEEVDAISSGLAIGLQNTKVAIDPKTGPWIPLGLAATAYALPRIVDVVMRSLNAKEPAPSGTFREVPATSEAPDNPAEG